MHTYSTAPLSFRMARPSSAGHSANATSAARAGRRSQTTLHKGALFSVTKPKAHTIECVQGLIWITHDNQRDDIILAAGQSHVAQNNARMIAQGLEKSEMCIHIPREQSLVLPIMGLPHRISALWARVLLARRAISVVR